MTAIYSEALVVVCPSCRAPIGEPCTYPTFTGEPQVRRTPCLGRIRASEAAPRLFVPQVAAETVPDPAEPRRPQEML